MTEFDSSKLSVSGKALLPLVLFLALFAGTGLFLTFSGQNMAFYELSATVAILPAIVLALILGKEKVNAKLNTFLLGVGDLNIITMCMIYLLAGAFASVASAIGGVAATVHGGLAFLPPDLILPGLFIIGAFVSTAMGTSMGTIAAIAPIAVGVATQTDLSLPLLMGVVLGGAMFGDNLSMISDTTIAATRTQGCEMSDKFRMNLLIALPAAIVVVVLLWLLGDGSTVVKYEDYEAIKILPYVAILVLAVAGLNVFVVLFMGIVLSGCVGFFTVDGYTLMRFSKDIYAGFVGMNEIMVLSMLVGGLGALMRRQGGILWLLQQIDAWAARAKSKGLSARQSGEWSISCLAFLADLCVANNTVAIILTGHVAKEIAENNEISPKRSASLLDIFSCVGQGLIPYGAQLLLAGSIAKISPLAIAANNWYCLLLAVAAGLAIYFGWPKK